MPSALQPLLNFGEMRKQAKAMNLKEQEKFKETHVPRFKNEQELGEYLMTPPTKRRKTLNFNFINL